MGRLRQFKQEVEENKITHAALVGRSSESDRDLLLTDFLPLDSWVSVKGVHRPAHTRDKVIASFHVANAKGQKREVDRIRIQIGRDITDELKWKNKDKIGVFQHPDDQLIFRLVNGVGASGYSIDGSTQKTNMTLNFKWNGTFKLEEKRGIPVDFIITKEGHLLLKIRMS